MIIRFQVENYQSIRDSQELSLIAGVGKELSTTIIQAKSVPHGILRVAAIYGANASGKSNLLKALNYFVGAVSNSHRKWKPDGPFLSYPFLLDEAKDKPSTFEIDFVLKGTRFQYGFSAHSSGVLKEWLYSYPKQRKQLWFERTADGVTYKFGKKLVGENRAIEKATRPNSLFLSAAAQNGHDMLLPIFAWISESIRFSFGDRTQFSPITGEMCADPSTNEKVARIITAADLGVVGLDVEKKQMDEGFSKAVGDFMQAIQKAVPALTEPPKVPTDIFTVSLRHRTKDNSGIQLPFANESSGTVAFLGLICPALSALSSGGILCIDELSASLHPLLALEIVRLFSDPAKNPNDAQLIFNTHDVNLLDSSVLRRDEIWFTEKDKVGATHLYSLGDFKPRKQENLKRGYLQGRYGAVPFLGGFDFNPRTD